MVLELCSCFGAAPAAAAKKAASTQQLIGEVKKQQAVGDQEASGGEAGEPTAVDRSMVAKEEERAPLVMVHQLPFHSRPGLM
ncbi:hypothetical protein SETIT_8G099700v2 [Setaria italica]|uniref:Uncharacterized protein n=1 Tax=Setaria italica TaxID=4555 RepID=A0A368S629_SETIT|nr:hypothetical protein SETIT_8G099700v2 [Setaria italica]